jgi:hypothetical protein
MKSLITLFAVTAVLGVAAIAAPASAATTQAKIKMNCDFTQSREDQKECVCVAEVRESKWIDGRLTKVASWRPAICPANGGGGGIASSDEPSSKPEKRHDKTISKAESSSSVESKGSFHNGSPVAETEQHEHTTSFTTGSGGAAGADANSDGGAIAGSIGSLSGSLGSGSTGGSTCAGNNC